VELVGLNEAAKPAGRPDAVKVTVPAKALAKPPRGLTVMVAVPFCPWPMVRTEVETARS